jgi:hypothetical protein
MHNYGNLNITKNVIVSFMDFFSRIRVERLGTAVVSGSETLIPRKYIQVPIQWATRDKWFEIYTSSSARKAMDPAIRDQNPVEMQWILPRISANLSGIIYDQGRRQIKTQQVREDLLAGYANSKLFTPAPYNLDFDIVVISKFLDDQFQVMEQILPFFSPGLSLDLKLMPTKAPDSVEVYLNSVMPDLPTDLAEADERFFTFTYQFTARINYYMEPYGSAGASGGGPVAWVQDNIYAPDSQEYIRATVEWNQQQQYITTRFEELISTAAIPNPFV